MLKSVMWREQSGALPAWAVGVGGQVADRGRGPNRGDRFAGLGLKARAGSRGLKKKASGGMNHST